MANHRIRLRHRKPSSQKRAELLATQQNRCFYCYCPLGEFLEIKGKVKHTGLHWDHVIPWSYCMQNDDANFVAACQACNLIKSSKVFDRIGEAKYYVRQERIKRGLPLFELPKPIRAKATLAKILPSKMPDGALLENTSNRAYRPTKTRIGIINGEYVAIPDLPPP